MGTDRQKLLEKKKEFLKALEMSGFSQRKFADYYLEGLDFDCTEDQKRKFREKLKKDMGRDTTKISVVNGYLEVLYDSEEYRRSGWVRPQVLAVEVLTAESKRSMRSISKELTVELQSKQYDEER